MEITHKRFHKVKHNSNVTLSQVSQNWPSVANLCPCVHTLNYISSALSTNHLPPINKAMGNKASRPARKLTNTIVHTGPVVRSSQPHLPSQEEMLNLEQTSRARATKSEEQGKEQTEQPQQNVNPGQLSRNENTDAQGPEGKDGMDPTADKAFIDSISMLGRQIQSHSARNPAEQLDVTALKQLLNRKVLYEKGQNEVKAQLNAQQDTRTMIHPRTLTAILNAINEHKAAPLEVLKDYQVQEAFLENLSRFRVASNMVIIEEDHKDDEIGPKIGQPTARAASEGSMIDYNGDMTEAVNQDRIKQLRKRLE